MKSDGAQKSRGAHKTAPALKGLFRLPGPARRCSHRKQRCMVLSGFFLCRRRDGTAGASAESERAHSRSNGMTARSPSLNSTASSRDFRRSSSLRIMAGNYTPSASFSGRRRRLGLKLRSFLANQNGDKPQQSGDYRSQRKPRRRLSMCQSASPVYQSASPDRAGHCQCFRPAD